MPSRLLRQGTERDFFGSRRCLGRLANHRLGLRSAHVRNVHVMGFGVQPESFPTRCEPGACPEIPARSEPGKWAGEGLKRPMGGRIAGGVDHRIDGDRHEEVSCRKGLEAMQEVAASRGGQCLTSQYRHCAQKLTWLCDRGHIWQVSWASIQRLWCPECARMSRITNAASKARRRYGVDTRLAMDPAVEPELAPAQAVS